MGDEPALSRQTKKIEKHLRLAEKSAKRRCFYACCAQLSRNRFMQATSTEMWFALHRSCEKRGDRFWHLYL